MKKITAIILSFVMLISFAGCSDKKSNEEKSESKPVKTVTVPYKSDYPYLYLREKSYEFGYVDYITNDGSAYTNDELLSNYADFEKENKF